ncbi:hypothetical protein SAMN04487771_100311 [[Clostridium] aminophilum]|uniref:Inner membrane protein yeeR n=1 Tax=[Clostridium] aminophilum TaxID=1526 RepID=A0A1I0AXC1_9FIRM|nr:hypothetical protein [[Clostridium] aminophilum]SES99041.1 hypothetical protein SAMN04487771_100311 [[Clostridium] aminophilum]
MDQHQEKIALMRKYASDIKTSFPFHIKGDIPSKIIDNAIKKWANGLDRTKIIGFYDTTVMNIGKEGYIFTDTQVYYLTMFEKPKKLWYDDIESVSVEGHNTKDCKNRLVFHLYDGTTVAWEDSFLNKKPLKDFFDEMLKLINGPSSKTASIQYADAKVEGAIAGGVSAGAYSQVNKSFDEERFHSAQGHGFAAERANNLYDKLTGHDARIVGDDNVKNGADRIVDGVMIQSKYCQTGSKCINECFDENGNFRYLNNGKPMQIEVPSDKYDAAVQAMEEKIRQGKIPGVTDPEEAKNIVRRGHFTYEQAKNIAKAGTVESLTYDAVNGAIIATSAFGVTAIITLASNLWNGEDFDKSLKLATYSGLKVGGTAFITTIIAGQLSKAGLNSALVGSSEAVVAFMGPKASAILINAFRNGSNIYGAAAMKSASKLLRGNVITASVTVVVLSSFDVVNIFQGRISGKQLFKNLTNTASTVGGGTAGWLGGAAVGSAILPGVGTIVGGLIGSMVVGAGAGKLSDTVLGTFIEDDAEEMVRIIQQEFGTLSTDYLLLQKEAEKTVDRLSDKLDGSLLKDMFASSDRHQFARNLLVPIIESETKKRKHIATVSDEQMAICLRSVLEDISDAVESDNNPVPAY